MKRFLRQGTLMGCFVLSACAGAPAHEPPASHGGEGEGPPLEVRVDERSGALLMDWGPVELHGGHGHAMTRTPLLSAELPFEAWLTGFEIRLLGPDGEELPQSLLHHVNVMVPNQRDLFRPIMQRLLAAGEETGPLSVPWPFGVPTAGNQRVVAFAMLHNPTHEHYGPVTLEMKLRYKRGGRRAVQPFFLDVSPPPAHAAWDLPPGRSSRHWEGSPAVGGRIMVVGGHLHRYGTELVLEDVTAGKVLLRLTPEVRPDGSIERIARKTFVWRLGIPLRTDHTYRITAVYDNPTGDTIPDGAMGAIGGMLIPSEQTWPAADPSDPLYRQDLEGMIRPAQHVH